MEQAGATNSQDIPMDSNKAYIAHDHHRMGQIETEECIYYY